MEAVRLGFPPEVTRMIQAYASDRGGIHPTAEVWDETVERFDHGKRVRWIVYTPPRMVGSILYL